MTDEFIIDLATPEDDAALRQLVANNPMPGAMQIAYCREPNFFTGCQVMGDFYQVFVCRRDHEPVGVAMRSIREMFINGQPQHVGYLSQLRLAPPYRGRGLTRRAFAFGRHIHEDGRTDGYITTIIELNKKARAILERHREPFPYYRDIGRLCTLAIVLNGRQRVAPWHNGISIERGGSPEEVSAFLRREGAKRQFFPTYSASDFNSAITQDFTMRDMFIARYDGRIVGTLGLWQQHNFKQNSVTGYSTAMRISRPAYNLWSRLRGAQPLPKSGGALEHAYASFVCIQDNHPEIFAALLDQAMHLAYKRGNAYLTIGLIEHDPLLSIARRHPHITYHSRLYTVTWDEKGTFHANLDTRLPYIELATL